MLAETDAAPINTDRVAARSRIGIVASTYNLRRETLEKVIYHRSRGYNNSDVARILGISRNTVNTYTRAMKRMTPFEVTDVVGYTMLLQGETLATDLVNQL